MNIANKISGVSISTSNGICRVVLGDTPDDGIVINDTVSSETRSLRDIVEIPPLEDDTEARSAIDGYVLESDLDAETAVAIASLYEPWEPDKIYQVDKIVARLNTLYRVIQAHTSQADWLPENTPALFVKCAPGNVIPDWVQPTGAHDAYQIGDMVQFSGHVYRSKINANVWSPTAYPAGWELVE